MSVPDPETGETARLSFTYRDVQAAMAIVHEAWTYALVRLYLLKGENMPPTRINRAISDYQNIRAHNDTALSIRL